MAPSFSNAKQLSAFVIDRFSVAVTSRGYAAASQGVVSSNKKGGMRSSVMMKKTGEDSTKNTSWVPDPVTGYYRPENQAKEMDAAELRELLLNHKIRRN